LIVGASTTPGIYLLPAVVGAFRAHYPGIDLRLQIGNSRLIEERVRANDVDLGVVGGHELVPGERCLAAGLVDELMLVVPPRHPWVGRRQLAPARLEEQPMLLREEGSATRRVMERALQQAGIAVRTGMELGHTEAIKQGVIAGLGVAFVSTYAIRGELATRRLHALRLSGLRIQRHFHVIHNDTRELSATARAFARLLDEEGRRLRVQVRSPHQTSR
jgi:DNA-binding transcriptional LysR family regulator